ncbi:purine-nucleoside phosphorylase [Brooklawnia cerclae]|uniref:Uridine phosphorylase n=1 Tax=Brooklawnia cerclae TaxID=349934 RepID=A0ABX0SAE9_9ACTN|nr:purine-nucleoside phosphorylase [Brooklawnia cerclae]
MATPHISAEPGDFAPAVLLPGDPKRAERIAKLLMPDARLISDVRGALAFTGTVDGQPLSVMGSGMGMPSATLYATELYKFYGVERIIRVGTCGGIARKVQVGDVVIALGAHTDSNMNQQRLPGLNYSAVASYDLVRAAVDAVEGDQRVHVGMITSHDHFYFSSHDETWLPLLDQYGVLGVEMESAGIYGAAAEFGKQALTVLTCSDHLLDASHNMSAEQRETSFQGALRLAVAAAHS